MTPQPVYDAVNAADPGHTLPHIYVSPKGERLTHALAAELGRSDGFLLLCGHYEGVDQRALDLTMDREISIGDLADELIRQINPEARVVCEAERLRPGKSEVERLLGDASKLRALTGWQPAYTFEQGLAQTIEWLRGNMDGYKVDAYNL